jgi:hypothetical protein
LLTQDKILKKLRDQILYLKNTFRIKKIGIFGSYANSSQNKKSDIDVFVEFEKPIGLDFMDLAIFLEELFGKKVDILTPEGIKSIRVRKIASNIEKSIIYA